MQTYKINFSDEATSDLNEILSYYKSDPEISFCASFILEAIYTKINSLETLPERFPIAENFSTNKLTIRACHSGRYKIYYHLNKSNLSVNIYRIIHQSRNPKETNSSL